MVSRLNHPSRFLLHAFRRAQYTLSSTPGIPFTDGLLERQQRLSDMDRQIFKSSWAAFRWILRLLPILAALQSFWLIYSETQLFLGKQSEFEQFANAFWPAMLPLVQLTVLAVFLGLAHAFLNRLEGLYLANLDASLYDQILSELPIRSSDTLLILNSLQKHFRELQVTLKRLELEIKEGR
jgi:NADH:ubiquinone oxidoreductase subunit 5 (subunit L)/multisubunit Na+/H+ antiporter MnhA subunit